MQEPKKYKVAFYARMGRDNSDVMRNKAGSIESKISIPSESVFCPVEGMALTPHPALVRNKENHNAKGIGGGEKGAGTHG